LIQVSNYQVNKTIFVCWFLKNQDTKIIGLILDLRAAVDDSIDGVW
jgi:hypothetical protein